MVRPVAWRNSSYSALVTWQRPRRNGATDTRCTGRSSSRPSAWPIRNSPPGMSTRSGVTNGPSCVPCARVPAPRSRTAACAQRHPRDRATRALYRRSKTRGGCAAPRSCAHSRDTCSGISVDKRVKDLTNDEVALIQREVSSNYVTEGELRKEIMLNIRRLKDIKCYRGLRHAKGLPVRGQRTKTNARTRKGPRGASIALKKKVTKK